MEAQSSINIPWFFLFLSVSLFHIAANGFSSGFGLRVKTPAPPPGHFTGQQLSSTEQENNRDVKMPYTQESKHASKCNLILELLYLLITFPPLGVLSQWR